jgi:hypothetical protein
MAQKQSKNYFTQDTEDAIVTYNSSEDLAFRNKVYNDRIKYPFFKLTENIIHTYKFYYTEQDSIEDLQHEVTTFLLSKLHLFDPTKGAKAYSYFGTIAKRYLIMTNSKNYKRKIDKVGVVEVEDNQDFSYTIRETVEEDVNLSTYIDHFVNYATDNIYELFPKDEDTKIADAILEIFRNRLSLNILNKKALYIYIREQIDVKTPKITKVANELYDIFKTGYITYVEDGVIAFPKIN